MSGVRLAELTTLRLGGPAWRLLEVGSAADLVAAVSAADRAGDPVLVVAGGSNLVVADAGFDGVAVHVTTRGVEAVRAGERVRLTVAAGEPWDALVARCVADGLAGIECLSGIPGSTGATPIQNVGAYGQEVATTLVSVRAYDREAGATVVLDRERCGFAYRSSAFKGSARFVILEVTLELEATPAARAIAYPQLAATLGFEPGARTRTRTRKSARTNPDVESGSTMKSFMSKFESRTSVSGVGVKPVMPGVKYGL